MGILLTGEVALYTEWNGVQFCLQWESGEQKQGLCLTLQLWVDLKLGENSSHPLTIDVDRARSGTRANPTGAMDIVDVCSRSFLRRKRSCRLRMLGLYSLESPAGLAWRSKVRRRDRLRQGSSSSPADKRVGCVPVIVASSSIQEVGVGASNVESSS